MYEIVDLGQQDTLELGLDPSGLTVSERSYNLILSLLSLLDERDRWGKSELELNDSDWAAAYQDVSKALWEMMPDA